MSKKLWGGRFARDTHQLAANFSASIEVDQKLAAQDLRGSLAHVEMLQARGILSAADGKRITRGLHQIQKQLARGEITWRKELEDIHMNIEALLTERIGTAGGKLHTARSRNDQVATDMRLWVREACDRCAEKLHQLVAVLAEQAEQHVDTLMPGYTHLQRAQPTRLAHHLLAWTQMFERDRQRLYDARRRLNECPLGAGALNATTFPIDRQMTAKQLGFDRPMPNSLDAVADRDYLVETVAALANCAVHLSRVAEELVLWSSQEFSFVDLGDAFTTGSSMMPQKKNPDMAELIRGKTGRVVGHLVNLLVMLKGLPLTYNRDLQEDKEPVFDAFGTVEASLDVMTAMLAHAKFDKARMRQALVDGYVNATELADYLADKGVAFRSAHHIAGQLVAMALEQGKSLEQLSLDEMQQVHPSFGKDVYKVLLPEVAIERRNVIGGPARRQVNSALRSLKKRLETSRR